MTSPAISQVLRSIGAKPIHGHAFPVGKVFYPPKDHPLWHPRNDYPVKPTLRDNIIANGFRSDRPLTLWQQVAEGGEVTLDGSVLKTGDVMAVIGDGSRRGRAAYEASVALRTSGKLGKDKDFLVPVKWFSGTEGDFHLMRQAEDSDPDKEPHAPSVVAANYIAAQKSGKTLEEMIKVAPRNYTPKTVEYLLRWADLPPKAAALFDAMFYQSPQTGKVHEVDINVLPPLLDLVPYKHRYAKLVELAENNRRRTNTATRYLNKQIKEAQVDSAEAESAEGSGEDENEVEENSDTIEDEPFEEEDESESETEETPSNTRTRGAKASPGLRTPVERVNAKLVRKAGIIVSKKQRTSAEERAFFQGATLSLGKEDALSVIKQFGNGMDPKVVHALAGMLWRHGVQFTPAVQAFLKADVFATIKEAKLRPSAAAAEKENKSK